MDNLRLLPGWLLILASLLAPALSRAASPTPTPVPARSPAHGLLPLLDDLPEPLQRKARQVIEKPAMYARGPAETFRCQPDVYHWLLDHPDRALQRRAFRDLPAEAYRAVHQGRMPGRRHGA